MEQRKKESGIRLEDVAAGYGRKALLNHISLHVSPGNVLTLIGPNGAGKSTILKTVTRQLAELGGTIFLEGTAMSRMREEEVARTLAMVMTERLHPEFMTCREVVATGRYPYTGRLGILSAEDWKLVDDAMQLVHAGDTADRNFSQISDGQRQRVMLARAICQEPEVIVLDEPTSFLDIRYKLELLTVLKQLVREKQVAVILSLHEIDLAQKLSDRLRAEKCFVLLHSECLPICDVVQILRERRQAALERLERVGRDARGHLRAELLLQGLPARDDGRGLVRAHEAAAPPVAGVARAQQISLAHELVDVKRHDARLEPAVCADVARGVQPRIVGQKEQNVHGVGRHVQLRAQRLHDDGVGVEDAARVRIDLRCGKHGGHLLIIVQF